MSLNLFRAGWNIELLPEICLLIAEQAIYVDPKAAGLLQLVSKVRIFQLFPGLVVTLAINVFFPTCNIFWLTFPSRCGPYWLPTRGQSPSVVPVAIEDCYIPIWNNRIYWHPSYHYEANPHF